MLRLTTWLVAAGLTLVGAACSVTGTVDGTMEDGSETFQGTVTGYMDRSGILQVSSNRGAQCKGTWLFVTDRLGRGTFRCEDGRSGPFEFVSTGSHGTGTGRLADKRFTFTFTR